MICPTTPIGSLKISERYFPSKTFAEPSSARIQPAKYLNWITALGISTAIVFLIDLPLSIDSIFANFSLFFSLASAISFNNLLLSCGVVFFQVLKAIQAASTALTMSSLVASAKVERSVPSTGDFEIHLSSGFVD